MLDEIINFKEELNTSGKIAFMPGSRKTEIKNHMPVFKELAKQIPNKEHILIIPSENLMKNI